MDRELVTWAKILTATERASQIQPFACDEQIRLTAPSEMFRTLKTIARIKKTSRLDVIRFALRKYIEEQSV